MSKYYHTKESVDEYINMSAGINGLNIITELKKYLSLNSKILELGSGPGSDYEILDKDFNITGSDMSMEFIDRLKSKYPEGKFLNLDAVTLNTDLQFSSIYSNKVLIHLNDAELESSVVNQHKILNQHGIICHSFWKGDGFETFKGLFVNYQNEKKLRYLFEKKFDIISFNTYKEFETDDSIFMIAKRKE